MKYTDIVLVACPFGRCGSSSTMGILDILGLDIGLKDDFVAPNFMNPKGFFELKSHEYFLREVFSEYYPDFKQKPKLENIIEISKKNINEYSNLLNRLFKKKSIAIKSNRLLTFYFYKLLQENGINVKVIYLKRDINEQANSILNVWEKDLYLKQSKISIDIIKNFIKDWESFFKNIDLYCKFEKIELDFINIIKNPLETTQKLADFLGLEFNKSDEVTDFIDNKLSSNNSEESYYYNLAIVNFQNKKYNVSMEYFLKIYPKYKSYPDYIEKVIYCLEKLGDKKTLNQIKLKLI